MIRYGLGLILALLCATMPVVAQNACSTGLDGAHRAEPSTTTVEAEAKQHSNDLEGDKIERVSRFIDEKLAAWQRRLKLEDWKIAVTMSRRADLKPRTLGGIRWDKRKKTAVMAVLDPSEYRLTFEAVLADIEFTIVHELVHLELSSLPRSEASRSSEERAVNQITEALLGLAREK